MPETHHLSKRKRGGGYYFRRRVPPHLQKTIGGRYVQFSLNTTNLRTAVKRREIEDVKWSATFDEPERRLALPEATSDQTPPTNKKALTKPVAIRLVQEYVERMDAHRASGWSADAPPCPAKARDVSPPSPPATASHPQFQSITLTAVTGELASRLFSELTYSY